MSWEFADNGWTLGPTWQTGWCAGKVTAINPATKVVNFQFLDHATLGGTAAGGGNGAGLPIRQGSRVRHNGVVIHDVEFRRNECRIEWYWIMLVCHEGMLYPPPTGPHSRPKGFMEIKYANNVTIEGNVFTTGKSCAPYRPFVALLFNQVTQLGNGPWIGINNASSAAICFST